MTDFAAEYEDRCGQPSDIAPHLPFLYDTAAGYDRPVVVELGVRTGNSTAAFLAAAEQAGGTVWSADIGPAQVPGWWHENPRWHFRQGDDLGPGITTWAPKQCDVLFIDTEHTYEQMSAELAEYGRRVRPGGVIMAHDTQFVDGSDAGTPCGPVARALDDWCAAQGLGWVNREGSYGLGVIRL